MSAGIAIALLMAPITDPKLLRQLNSSQAKPWEADPIVRKARNPFDKYDEWPPAPSPGPYELVVRFPGNSMGYNHVYRSFTACNAARRVILADHRDRMQAADQSARAAGDYTIPGPPPVAVCVPQ